MLYVAWFKSHALGNLQNHRYKYRINILKEPIYTNLRSNILSFAEEEAHRRQGNVLSQTQIRISSDSKYTNIYDFAKLLGNVPVSLSELARLADVSEPSHKRLRDGFRVS